MNNVGMFAEFFIIAIFLVNFKQLKKDPVAISFALLSFIGALFDITNYNISQSKASYPYTRNLNYYTFVEIFFLAAGALIITKHKIVQLIFGLFVLFAGYRIYQANIVESAAFEDTQLIRYEFYLFLAAFVYWLCTKWSEGKIYWQRWFWCYLAYLYSLFCYVFFDANLASSIEGISFQEGLVNTSVIIRSVLLAIGLTINPVKSVASAVKDGAN
jgi:hypothetical protein